MKRLALILIALLTIFCGTSCKTREGDPFSVFDSDFTVSVSANCEGQTCAFIYNSREKSARFISPGELSGYVLRLDGGKALLSYDGTEIEVSEYAGRLIYVCNAVFSASKTDVTEITAREMQGEAVTAVKANGAEYIFASNGTPLSVSGNSDGISFEFKLTDFSGEKS